MARHELNRTPKKWDPYLDEPVKVVVRELRRGMWVDPIVIDPPGIVWCLDDGHHRYERSLVLGRTTIKADVTVEASPVRALLLHFKTARADTALLEALGQPNRPSASPEPTDLVRRRLLNQGFPVKLVTELLDATGPTRARDAAWMGRRIQQQVRATPAGGQRDVVKALLGTVRLLAAWILATRPNYTKMPLDEALGAAEAWSRVPIPVRSRDVVHDFGDGWAWVRVPVNEYAAEGAALRCSLSAKYRRFTVFSLRDPKNRSHAALTAFQGKRGWELKEVKGKANARPPAPAYSTRIVSWLLTKPLGELRLFRLGAGRARDDLAAVLSASEIPARLGDVLALEGS